MVSRIDSWWSVLIDRFWIRELLRYTHYKSYRGICLGSTVALPELVPLWARRALDPHLLLGCMTHRNGQGKGHRTSGILKGWRFKNTITEFVKCCLVNVIRATEVSKHNEGIHEGGFHCFGKWDLSHTLIIQKNHPLWGDLVTVCKLVVGLQE